MKKLYLSRKQAEILARDLQEYLAFEDSSKRFVFKGFEISFGDNLASKIHDMESFEMTPIPDFLEME